MSVIGVHLLALPSLGAACPVCNKSEANCANRYPCCEACQHTFDGTSEAGTPDPICESCHKEFDRPKRGRAPKNCPDCRVEWRKPNKKGQWHFSSKKDERIDLPEPPPEHFWYVSPSGMAHLWKCSDPYSACNLVRIDVKTYTQPVTSWYILCKRCEGKC